MTRSQLLNILESNVLEGAPALLGATLRRGEMSARIVEVEAYRRDDPACHAFNRRTPRTEIMYGPAGLAYVYFNYGVHWMLNIVAHRPEDPAAILIRAALPLSGMDQMMENRGVTELRKLLSGPGKLAKAFSIDSRDQGVDLLANSENQLRIEPASEPVKKILTGPRIGIAIGKWNDVPWRFMDGDHLEWLSVKP